MFSRLKGADSWDVVDFIEDFLPTKPAVARNLVRCFDENCTVPFIARYRRDLTNNMTPDEIRKAEKLLIEARSIKKKAGDILSNIEKSGQLCSDLARSINMAQSIDELTALYQPFKPGSKKSLAEKARNLGLEPAAVAIMKGQFFDLTSEVTTKEKGLETVAEVEDGVRHIISEKVVSSSEVQLFLGDLIKKFEGIIRVETSISKKALDESEQVTSVTTSADCHHRPRTKADLVAKFNTYANFSSTTKFIKPHQILAINRGHALDVLNVTWIVPDAVQHEFVKFVMQQYRAYSNSGTFRSAVEHCYSKRIKPTIVRRLKTQLTRRAQLASIDVFAQNLRQLLLTPPVTNCTILGVDPGFKNGCKFAVISELGTVLTSGVFYLPAKFGRSTSAANYLRDVLLKHSCQKVAIGNGTACRETEQFLSDSISAGTFRPLNVEYCVTKLAEEDLPGIDPNQRSAVSIARRLQDPLSEYVKIDAKHLGVGMYQHDLKEKELNENLDSIVQECVSFVGVNLNTCSLHLLHSTFTVFLSYESYLLLRRVSGLSSAMALKILEYRTANGGFTNREQLKLIKGIGQKTWEQAVGFVRIFPVDNNYAFSAPEDPVVPITKKRKLGSQKKAVSKKSKSTVVTTSINYLDATAIHPESYGAAELVLNKLGASVNEIGSGSLINKAKQLANSESSLRIFADEFGVGFATLTFIVQSLQLSFSDDYREALERPLFRSCVRSLQDVKAGQTLTGSVMNIVHFGAFVDIGVGINGLIYIRDMLNLNLQVGAKVEVQVLNIDAAKQRIGLKPVQPHEPRNIMTC